MLAARTTIITTTIRRLQQQSTTSRRASPGNIFAVGDRVAISKRVDRTDVDDFARLSGDTNPVHSGDRPLVHGIYLAGLVSGVIGTKLPGEGTLVVSKTMRFPNPCYAGDLVEIQVEILTARKLVRCGFWCRVGDKVVMEGTADVISKRVTKSPGGARADRNSSENRNQKL